MKNWLVKLCMLALLAGCNSPSQPPQSGNEYKGREETKKLEGASAVGYDGKAIRKNVDNTLNKNDDRNKDIDNAVKSESEK